MLNEIITTESTHIDAEQSVQQRVKQQIEKTQRDFYLNEQMKALQQEMDGGNEKSDFFDLEKKIKRNLFILFQSKIFDRLKDHH